jgi:hypothetical protein
MKLPLIILPILSAGFLFSSCEKPSAAPEPRAVKLKAPAASPGPAAPVKVDADLLLKSFGMAGPEEQSRVGKAAQAIRAENFGSALEILEHLLAQGHLTSEQRELVKGFIAQLQNMR